MQDDRIEPVERFAGIGDGRRWMHGARRRAGIGRRVADRDARPGHAEVGFRRPAPAWVDIEYAVARHNAEDGT